MTADDDGEASNERPDNDGDVFDRLPGDPAARQVPGRASRSEVVDWWDERFGIDPDVFEDYTFWEKGAGKVWIFHGEAPSPTSVEALGMTFLRTRQEHWKPTTSAAQRFGKEATRNVIVLEADAAAAFVRGENQEVNWDGDWGYLIASHEIAGDLEPIGVGLYVYGEFRSLIPKGRREQVPVVDRPR